MFTKRIVYVDIFRQNRMRWLILKKGNIHDFYFHKAKREDYSARSVYKLKNIQEKYHLFSKGNKVLDLGASPGSWTEYLIEILGQSGTLVALDLKPLSLTAHEKIKKMGLAFQFLEQSVFDDLPEDLPLFDAIVSDMAPATQGNRTVDTARSLELIERAYEICRRHLKMGGHFVVKLFHSEDTITASKNWESAFKMGKLVRPPAVRKESKEIYFVVQNFLGSDSSK